MKKRWIFLCLAVAAVGVGWSRSGAPEPTPVTVVRLARQSVEKTVSCNGTVQAGSSLAVTVETGCVLERVEAQAGQAVTAGEALAQVNKAASRGRQPGRPALEALTLAAMEETVCAPADGILMTVDGREEEWLPAGEALATLAPLSGLEIRVMIPEKQLRQVRVGQTVRVQGDGFAKKAYTGVLSRIAATGTVSSTGDTAVEGIVTLDAGEADASLRLGLTARAEIVTAVTEGLLLPYEAVQEDAQGVEFVYLAEQGQAVRHDLSETTELKAGVLVADDRLEGRALILNSQSLAEGMAVDGREETGA